MQIAPRYGSEPIIVLPGRVDEIRTPFLRQRRRLVTTVQGLDLADLERPSRCEGWMGRDVLAHLTGVDGFWGASIALGIDGRPTTFLATFDPKETPAQLVGATREKDTTVVVEELVAATQRLCEAVEALDAEAWEATAEAPPGHVPVRTVLHHALWDCWIHERDILLPLGLAAVEEDDEVAACLRYVAALNPAIALGRDPSVSGNFSIEATRPDVSVQITVDGAVEVSAGGAIVGGPVLRGGAVDLVEALSVRAPFPDPVPPLDPRLLGGLAEVFETL